MTTLVLLPGLDGTGLLFAPLIEALLQASNQHTVSYPANLNAGYEAYIAHARRQLPSTGNFFLLGESFSGPVAISLAAEKPPGLQGLILCSTFARSPYPLLRPAAPLLNVLPVKATPAWLQSRMLFGRFTTPALQTQLQQVMHCLNASVMRTRLRNLLHVDVSAQLAQLQLPVLHLAGTEDRLLPASTRNHIARVLPHSRLVELAAPHGILQALPNETAHIISGFMADCEQHDKLRH